MAAVLLLLLVSLPGLTASLQMKNRWQEIFGRDKPQPPPTSVDIAESYICCNLPLTPIASMAPAVKKGHRHAPLSWILQELARLEQDRQQTRLAQMEAEAQSLLLPAPSAMDALPLQAGYPARRQALLARLLARSEPGMVNVPGASFGGPEGPGFLGSLGSQSLSLGQYPVKRGGFIEAPGSAGGPNMGGR